jgi:hypothetical protein
MATGDDDDDGDGVTGDDATGYDDKTMVTVNDDNDVDGDSAMGNKVDHDGKNSATGDDNDDDDDGDGDNDGDDNDDGDDDGGGRRRQRGDGTRRSFQGGYDKGVFVEGVARAAKKAG